MNRHFYLIAFIFLSLHLSLSAQINKQPLRAEFTEKGASKNNTFQPFKSIVYFGIDEMELDAKSKGKVDKLYELLVQREELQVHITGHSNSNCDTQFCEEIANQRAENVAFYLFEKGLSPLRLQYNGLGKKQPAVSNRTSQGREKNQRVEIQVYQKK